MFEKYFYVSYSLYIMISGENFAETALDSWVTIALKHNEWHLRWSGKNYVNSDAFKVNYTDRTLSETFKLNILGILP